MKKRVVIIGAGAAGVFAAAVCAEMAPHLEVIVLEKTRQPLAKVRISGGGRCNVTHAQFDPKKLVSNYPRGHKELLGPFHHFQPQDTFAWFKRHGVTLKIEEDGRCFPTTDHSSTIVNCLLDTAKARGVFLRLETSVTGITAFGKRFSVQIEGEESLECDTLLLATGSSPRGLELAASLGHTIVPAVPSLFTLNTPTSSLLDLSGITLPDAELTLPQLSLKQRGALLLTHFGFSGPAALKLSSFGARELHACHYRTALHVCWVPSLTKEEILQQLLTLKKTRPAKQLENENPFHLPSNLWKRLLVLEKIPHFTSFGHIADKQLHGLAERLTASPFAIEGKTTHKAEFVTAGGIELKEIDFKTLQSKIHPHLFFAGEILNIDGVTGGFNFQNAWTTAYLAARHIAQLFLNLKMALS